MDATSQAALGGKAVPGAKQQRVAAAVHGGRGGSPDVGLAHHHRGVRDRLRRAVHREPAMVASRKGVMQKKSLAPGDKSSHAFRKKSNHMRTQVRRLGFRFISPNSFDSEIKMFLSLKDFGSTCICFYTQKPSGTHQFLSGFTSAQCPCWLRSKFRNQAAPFCQTTEGQFSKSCCVNAPAKGWHAPQSPSLAPTTPPALLPCLRVPGGPAVVGMGRGQVSGHQSGTEH